ncbi:MAG: Gfo/Idh/MocA family oxidoreductase [Angelakisella sp.]
MKFAVIGTNFITDRFLEAARLHPVFSLAAVCASSMEKAESFAARHGSAPAYDDYRELVKLPELDGVYLATPNPLHHEMTLFFLEAGIPVLCEKPLAPTLRQADEMIALSARKNTLLLEGMFPLYTLNFRAIRESLWQLGKVRKANLSYCQYSSRYDSYRRGVVQNAFRLEKMGGSLLDIGIYPLYQAIALFGKPDRVSATAQLLDTGIDGSGTVVLSYPGFDAVVSHSKVSNTTLGSELQGEDGCLMYTGGSDPLTVVLTPRGGQPQDLARPEPPQKMFYEVEEFIRCIKMGLTQSPLVPHSLALEVYALTDEIRRQTGVKFTIE